MVTKTERQSWDDVLGRLTVAGLDKREVRSMVEVVSTAFGREAVPWLKVFPKGIPVIDGIAVHAILEKDNLGRLIDLLQSPKIDAVRVFPRGIIDPQVFIAEIDIRAGGG